MSLPSLSFDGELSKGQDGNDIARAVEFSKERDGNDIARRLSLCLIFRAKSLPSCPSLL